MLHVVSQKVVNIPIFVKMVKHLININDVPGIHFTVK